MKKRRFNRIMALLFAGVLFLEQTGMEQVSAFAGSGEQEKATTAEAADMQKCVEAVRSFYEGADLAGAEATEFGTKNLIVATELEEFGLLGAEEKISLGEGLYALSYADVKSAKAACEAYQGMEGIHFAEADLVVKAQTEEGNGKVDSMAKEPEAEKEESGTGKNPAADVDCKEQDTGKKEGEAEENVEIGRNSEDVETDTASGEQQETEEAESEENAREKKSEAAPEETAEDDRICVALLDTGIKTDIGNLASYIQDTGINISGSGDTGSTNDDNSHGTAMAQVIVSALEKNGKNSEDVKLLPVKVLDDGGYGTTLTTYLGMKAAMEQGADIICLGLSGKGESKLIESAVDEAHNAGITVIAAAGNDVSDASEYVPGSCEKAVVIASAKNREKAAEDSNYGDTVDFSAYGMKEVLNLAGETQTISGTSIACAYAAGVTASLERKMSDEKRMFCEEVEAELLKRAVPVTEESLIPYLGKGIIGEVPEAEQTKEDNTQDKSVKKAEKTTKAAGTINAVGTPAKGTAYIRYKAKYIGDTNANSGEWKNSGATCGTETKNTTKKMEALKFEYVQNGSGLSGGIYYRTHVTAYQWDSQTVINTGDTGNNFGGWTGTLATNATDSKSTWAKDGEWSGTTGKMKHLESYTLELYGAVKDYYCINYDAFGYKESFNTKAYGSKEDCLPKVESDWYNAWIGWDTDKRDLKNSWNNWSDPGGLFNTSWNFAGTYMCGFPIQAVRAELQPFKISRTIDPNGGTYNGSTGKDTADKNARSTEAIGTPTRTGYTFTGWTVTQTDLATNVKNFNQLPGNNKGGSWNLEKTVFTYGNKNVIFKANWEPNKGTIYYNTNTANGIPDSPHYYSNAQGTKHYYFKVRNEARKDYLIVSSQTKTSGFSLHAKNVKYTSGASDLTNVGTFGLKKEGYHVEEGEEWITSDGRIFDQDKEYTPEKYFENIGSIKSQTLILYANWKINTYDIKYNANGGAGIMENGKKTHGEDYTIKDNAFIREGYDFVEWNTKADGSGTSYAEGASYEEEESVTLYAIWKEHFNVAYIGNGQTQGADFIDAGEDGYGHSEKLDYTFDDNKEEDGAENAEEYFQKSDTVTYTDDETGETIKQEIEGAVVGWTMKPEDATTEYGLGETIPGGQFVATSIGKGNITYDSPTADYHAFQEKNIVATAMSSARGSAAASATIPFLGGVGTVYNGTPYVNLYAVWDMGPVIEAYDRYYTLEEAQDGSIITEEALLNAAKATDEELKSSTNKDGRLKNFLDKENQTSFTVMDYQAEEFTGLTGSAVISVTYRAEDAAGNVTKKMILVHIVDGHDTIIDGYDIGTEPDEGKVRFISEKYLDTLDEDSVWVKNEEYREALLDALSYRRLNPEQSDPLPLWGDNYTVDIPGTGEWNKKPQSVWTFTREQVKEAQQFVEDYGPSNYGHEDGLQKFYEKFSKCRQEP